MPCAPPSPQSSSYAHLPPSYLDPVSSLQDLEAKTSPQVLTCMLHYADPVPAVVHLVCPHKHLVKVDPHRL